MEEKEIIEGNILIAEFMMQPKVEGGLYPISGYLTPAEHLGYHRKWGWLMPVVINIRDLEITDFPKKLALMKAVSGLEFEQIYSAVVDFIKWHKQNS